MSSFLNRLNQLDTDLFLALNGVHNDLLDFVMWWTSDKYIWIPLYALFFYLLWKKYRQKIWIVMVFAALLIFLSDQISVHLFKDVFQRLRPCHEPALAGLVHTVNGKCGGEFGFYSSHASNTFAIAVFILALLRNKLLILPVLLWALLIAYSRIYLGVHYPGDVFAGAMAGVLLGYFLARFCKKAIRPAV